MTSRIPFWLREMFKVWVQYLVAGIAFIPAGILCVALLNNGIGRDLATIISVGIGLFLAYFAWKLVDKRIILHSPLPVTSQLALTYSRNVRFQISGVGLTGIAAATIIVISNASCPPSAASNLLSQSVRPASANKISLRLP